jgi:benzoyl-CoA reductase/2-hydroxyglutaryl-CoA dehydratase subunit BcrC/BadD/HgdB
MYYPPWDPNRDHKEQERLYVKYTAEQLRRCVNFCEKVTGKRMDWARLEEVVALTDRTWDLFIDTYELRKAIPTPMDTGDAMNTMVPLTFMLAHKRHTTFLRNSMTS